MSLKFLKANLCFLHGTMQASERLLKEAISECEDAELTSYFLHHLKEEEGHLAWLEEDLKVLNVKKIIQFREAATLAGAQYYYIKHVDPAMLLGYMAAMESGTVDLKAVDALEKAAGGPLKCVRHHCTVDPDHYGELLDQIAKLEPSLRVRVKNNQQWVRDEVYYRISPKIAQAAQENQL